MHDTKFLTLAEAAKQTPGRPSSATIWRWIRRGLLAGNGRRIHLEHLRAGRRVLVPVDALDRFLAELAAADRERFEAPAPKPAPPRPKARTQHQREAAVAAAKKRLAARGLATE